MPKVMLVEDDNNLREIYDARLAAEGYEIVSAHDGEEALAMAVKEKPDLIISDIMMPKISGFDMLDILRSTPETKNTKVIMMTALSQAEDRERAGKLGADRYLIKSQVTLEDVIKVAHEVLNDTGAPKPTAPAAAAVPPAAATPSTPAPVPAPAAAPAPEPTPVPPAPAPPVTPDPVASPPVATTPIPPAPEPPAPAPIAPPAPTPTPEPPAPVMPVVAPPTEPSADAGTVPAPVPEPTPEPAAEAPKEPPKEETPEVTVTPEDATKPADPAPTAPMVEPNTDNLSQTKAEEASGVEKQIQDFIANNPTLTSSATPGAPEPEPTPGNPSDDAAKAAEAEATPPAPAPEQPAPASPAETPGAPALATPPPAEPVNEPVASSEALSPPPSSPPVPAGQEALSNPSPVTNADGAADAPSHKKLVLTPTNTDLTKPVDLDALLEKEQQKFTANDPVETPDTNAIITPADAAPKPSDIAL